MAHRTGGVGPMTTQTSETGELDLTRIYEIADEEAGVEGAMIRVLQRVQEEYGFVPPEALPEVSDILEIPVARIYGCLTFYPQFNTSPPGRHLVKVCIGTACHVTGSEGILKALSEELGVEVGGTTPDRQFRLAPVACVGACELAPLGLVDGEYVGGTNSDEMLERVRGIKAQEAAGPAKA